MNLFWKILFDERGATLAITRVTSNTLITAAATNNRATEIEAVVNALTSANYAADSVTAAALNSDVVRSGYGLIQHTDGTLYVDVSDTTPCLEITDGGLRVMVDGTTITRGASGLVASVVSDHGALTGLTDDDHTAYLNTTRHDADDHSSLDYASMGINTLPVAKGGTGITNSLVKIVSWTGNGTAARNIAHGLGAAPIFLIAYGSSTESVAVWISPNTQGIKTSDGSAVAISCDATNIVIASGGDSILNINGRTYYAVVVDSN